jgi:heme oxygenase
VPSPKRYRDRYRALLDAAPWDAAAQAGVVAEVRRGYRLNGDLFGDLEARMAQWARPAG